MIKYQQENFYDWYPEAKDILKKNFVESNAYLADLKVNLDLAWYKSLSSANKLFVVTARVGAKLIGYHVSFIGTNAKFAGVSFGYDDAMYVDKEYRGQGVGAKLVHFTECLWSENNVGVFCLYTKGSGTLYKKKGYTPCERLYMKAVEV